MKVIWVLENVKKDRSFYNELQILLLISSVTLWRKHHGAHTLFLYCDSLTYDVFSELDIFKLWDHVEIFSYPEKINREIFWSSPKTKIISETSEPLVVVDHDFLIFTNIDEHLGDHILYSYDERSDNWYPTANDIYSKRLSTPIEFIVPYAANVSLFYLPDPEFARRYGSQVLINHQEFTSMNVQHMSANHMILSEQYMLRQWIEAERLPHKCLSKNIWDCHRLWYMAGSETQNGIWSIKESMLYYKHYGAEERRILNREPGYDYDQTISFLVRCIRYNKSIDIENLRKSIDRILNNESNTRKLDSTIL